MHHKLAEKHAHYQAHVSALSEECAVWEYMNNGKEIECHLDVDKVLSEPHSPLRRNNSRISHPNHRTSLHKQSHTNNNIPDYRTTNNKRENLIMKLNNGQKKKENILGSIFYSLFI